MRAGQPAPIAEVQLFASIGYPAVISAYFCAQVDNRIFRPATAARLSLEQ
jgi:hypothetical protein